MSADVVNMVDARLAEVAKRLRAELGHGGVALLEVRVGHDQAPFVYLSGLTDAGGTRMPEPPQQVLGVDGWLAVMEPLNELVRVGHLESSGPGRVVELEF